MSLEDTKEQTEQPEQTKGHRRSDKIRLKTVKKQTTKRLEDLLHNESLISRKNEKFILLKAVSYIFGK